MKIQNRNGIIIFIAVVIVMMIFIYNQMDSQTRDTSLQTIRQNDYFPTDEWRTSTPEEQGMDSEKLADMLKSIEKLSGIRSILIVRHGHLVLESYRAPYDKNAAVNVMSVTKSFMSALTGIAVREQYLTGVDQKVADLLPEYFTNADPEKKEITLEHLLTMSSGLPSVEPYDDQYEWPRSKDWVGHVVNLPLESYPGSNFTYSSGMSHMMSAVITKTSGLSIMEFAQQYLFDQIGIRPKSWAQDPNGIYNGGAYLSITPRDMAKFGYLYLNEGMWNGEEIIPKEWVKSSTKNQINTNVDLPTNKYGYWWWVAKDYYLASGWGGQFIMVNPRLDMVVVFTSIDPRAPLTIYKNDICKAVKSDTALKPNPSAVERMNASIERLSNPIVEFVKPDRSVIDRINGKVFKLNENELGFDSFSLTFDNSGCNFWYQQVNKKGQVITSEFPVGSNGEYKITPINYHATYFEMDKEQFPDYIPGGLDKLFINNRLFFPIDESDGSEKYSVAFEGHWADKNTFLLKGIWPMESPFNYLVVFQFDGNEVNLMLSATPLDFRTDIEGNMTVE